MKKIRFLYHGSSKRLVGNKLIPKKAKDISNNPKNTKKAVYATDIKNVAIAMAVISSKGVVRSSLDMFKVKKPGTIYKGKLESEIIYLYTLNAKDFKKSSPKSHQFFSTKAVKPIKTQKLKVKNYLKLIKYKNKKDF